MIGRKKPALAIHVFVLVVWMSLFSLSASAHRGDGGRDQPTASAQAVDVEGAPSAIGAHDIQSDGMTGMEMSDAGLAWPNGDDWSTNDGAGAMMMAKKERPETFGGRVIAWLGAWHPAVIHFPIALPLTALFLEILAWVRRRPIYVANNQTLLALGVAGAFVAAAFGWAGAGLPSATDEWALTTHRWLGSAIPLLLLLLWNTGRIAERAGSGRRSRSYYVTLAVTAAVLLAQGFLGGEVTHGANHMAF